ncbi:RNA pseudouridylate synthase domain-containing protein 2 [Corvus cornix cornix]|uniref:RNA pseudouridylate synthase domain-containing protein 2 n=1 Tax=Corvus cornix cornix TaxID=932674 RepID=UPI0019518AE5|nr:RNA pseudouridylate synthase domain-containing protein 2 [Corvus cornix cornix]
MLEGHLWSSSEGGSCSERRASRRAARGVAGVRPPLRSRGDMAEPGPGPSRAREEEPGPAGKEEEAPAPKKRRLAGGERYVPPPRKLNTGVSFGAEHFAETSYYFEGGLRKVRPYYFDFRTYCKGRWVGRSLLHVFGTEFRAQPLAYYRAAARAGRLRLNEEPVRDLDIVLKNNDFLRNTVHRHEPPVTAQPIRILAEDEEVVVVDKPSSLPVHPCGRFRHNTVIFILGKEHGLRELHTLHRLDRMTSGVLMFAKTAAVSKRIDEQVRQRQLEKEYVCRVVGEFPEHEVVCEEPILVVSYKVGVCRVDPKGKPCQTLFQRLSYNGSTSVVRCLPRTGRTHQIRVHLQFLGHPIVNDPIYNMEAWGPDRGKGGKIGKTDEELLKALVEEHRSKQSLDVLGIGEEDLNSSGESKDSGNSGDCTKSAEADPINGNSCPGEDEKNPKRFVKDPERNDVAACPLNFDINLEMLDKDKELGLCGNQDGQTGEKGWEEKDPLCVECRTSRRDPSPKELVMFLHALRYKGADFEYCSSMPEWATEDWEE